MLPLKAAAKLARERDHRRLDQAALQKDPLAPSVDLVQRHRAFHEQLLDALRKFRGDASDSQAVPEGLLLAFPERLLSRWFYLAYGPLRERSGSAEPAKKDPIQQHWKHWETVGQSTRFRNLTLRPPRTLLVAHGLSPIGDSILLLADLGRAARVALALGIPVHVMLADVSWMSYNRSVRRTTLAEPQIEQGLRLCLDQRLRLYRALRFTYQVHPILSYARDGAIHADKIRAIAQRYRDLIALLWGPALADSTGPLERTQLENILRPLPQSLSDSSPLLPLADFPGGLHALEQSLQPHLEIIRSIARRFTTLSIDTFSYYFAQYYAQSGYRGSHTKIAVESELDFDEPFDALDLYFRAWGDGGTPDISTSKATRRPKRATLAGIYLPQYQLGSWRVLPYSALSLDAVVNCNGQSDIVLENLILVSDSTIESLPKVRAIASNTVVADSISWNRICGDLVSLLIWIRRAHGRQLLDKEAAALAFEPIELILDQIAPGLAKAVFTESEEEADLPALWQTWLRNVERDEPLGYWPSHLLIASMTPEDWSLTALEASAKLVVLTNAVVGGLSS
jgi:hypothetical protein